MVPEDKRSEERKIPPATRRAVRQRCGFGCVICGFPLYEYDHMAGWANVHRHDADEITLLCDTHHREKTSGLLPIGTVRVANADPLNRRIGASSPYALHYSGEQCEALIGSNKLSARMQQDFAAVVIDGLPLIGFRFEDGHYLLNVHLFNELNEPVLLIADNELTFSSDPWDIELVGTRLIIRAAARSIFIDMTFEPPNGIRIDRGRLLRNGLELFIRPDFVLIPNNATLLRDNSSSGVAVGLNVGVDHRGIPSAFRVSGLPRYGYDRAAALKWAREQVGTSAINELIDDMPESARTS